MLLRHLLAIAALPVVVTVVVPVWVLRTGGIQFRLGASVLQLFAQAAGLLLLLVGLALFVSSLGRFATEGKGTLAPWDPPKRLVVRGPYRFVRNPMISGVVLILFAEALIALSRSHLMWALTFLGLNLVYIPILEEPQLRQRFGDAYVEYCRHVPRLVPRIRPWRPATPAAGDAI